MSEAKVPMNGNCSLRFKPLQQLVSQGFDNANGLRRLNLADLMVMYLKFDATHVTRQMQPEKWHIINIFSSGIVAVIHVIFKELGATTT